MSIFKKIGKEYKRVEKRVTKEIDRTVKKTTGKIDAEVGRAKAKYDPSIAIAGIAEFNTDELARRLKILAMRSTSDAIIITLDWFEEESRKSKSKLDDFLLPLLPMIRIQVRKLTDRIK